MLLSLIRQSLVRCSKWSILQILSFCSFWCIRAIISQLFWGVGVLESQERLVKWGHRNQKCDFFRWINISYCWWGLISHSLLNLEYWNIPHPKIELTGIKKLNSYLFSIKNYFIQFHHLVNDQQIENVFIV